MSETDKTNSSDIWPAKVFYDGQCPVCSREIDVYRRRAMAERLDYVDITAPDFRAEDYGLDPDEVQRALHVKLANGEVRRGVEGFRVIWRATPGMGWAASVAGWPGVKQIMALGYRLFARNRHLFKLFKSRDGKGNG